MLKLKLKLSDIVFAIVGLVKFVASRQHLCACCKAF